MKSSRPKLHRHPLECVEPRYHLAAGFQITLRFDGDLVEPEYQAYQAAFVTAAARWTAILTEDIPDVPSGPWGTAVDDLRINANATFIDGPGQILGGAQYQYRRSTGARLPITGLMEFDTADLNNSTIVDVITHEMGHVLGIGSLWAGSSLVNDYGGTNPQYIGAASLPEFRAMTANPFASSIPVENTGQLGTRDVHWRESVFGRELMTGYYQAGQANPLSRMSAASLIDLGYPGVNPDATNAYAPVGGNPAPVMTSVSPSSSTSPVGGSFTLTANDVTDTNGGTAEVRFYRETNGIPGLQASGTVTVKDELIDADTTGASWSANISLGSLSAGLYTYYAQATDVHGAISVYASTTHTIVAPPASPTAPDLDSASDSGASYTDNITNDNTPTFKGVSTEAAGSTIRVFANGIEIGQTTVAGDGTWTFTPAVPLGEGARSITAKVETPAGLSDASSPLTITIDTAAPTLSGSAFVYATLLGVTFEFNEDVTGSLGANDLSFFNSSDGTTHAAGYVGSTLNVATFRFASFPPPRGDYTATLAGNCVSDLAGNVLTSDPTVNFFYLPGDIDQSRSVDFDDLLVIAQNYGQVGTFAQGDVNYSGAIDFGDLLVLAQNYGQTLIASQRASSIVVSSKTRKRNTDDIFS
jgi:hypothetical protein